MTEIQIDAGTLQFSADDMTATGLLVPYGVECRSNLGRFKVDTGTFSIPADTTGSPLNIEHQRESVVGGLTKAWEQPEGIMGTFSFARTDEGRAAYEDAKSGKRKHLSAEVADVVIRNARAVSGRLFAAALVKEPAFNGATLLAAAADTEPAATDDPTTTNAHQEETFTDENGVTWTRVVDTEVESEGNKTTTTTTVVEETEEPEEEPAEDEEEPKVATVPNTLTAAATSAPAPITIREIGSMLYANKMHQMSEDDIASRLAGHNQSESTLFAALSDVKYDGTGGLASTMGIQPQWLGELWSSVKYRQQVLPLFAHDSLTSLTFNGFTWTTKPSGGDWAGNKAAVPSNTLVVAPASGTASRYAVGHDIAREFVDFPVPGFFESYAAAVTEDYAKWADGKVAAAIVAAATALAGDALTTLPGVAGGTIGSAASAIIDGATVLVTNGVLPDFALVAPALWKQLVKMPTSNVIGYLNASLGLAEGDLNGFVIRPSASIAAGKVLVGAREAVTVLELPGAPVRIDALDLVKGGVDKAAFGYLGVNVNDAKGLQLVTAAVA
ncbi:MAG: hypothetical protein ABWY36_06215 [Leifsonia sp.]